MLGVEWFECLAHSHLEQGARSHFKIQMILGNIGEYARPASLLEWAGMADVKVFVCVCVCVRACARVCVCVCSAWLSV